MSKKGKVPSLITSSSGNPKMVNAKRKRVCKRCDCPIEGGAVCVEIPQPGTMGTRTYCTECFKEIICKSREDLDRLEKELIC